MGNKKKKKKKKSNKQEMISKIFLTNPVGIVYTCMKTHKPKRHSAVLYIIEIK